MRSAILSFMLTVFTVTIIAVSAMAYLRFEEYLDIKRQEAKNEAVDECMHVSTLTQVKETPTDGEVTVSEPIRDTYKLCIEDKGYETKFKPVQ